MKMKLVRTALLAAACLKVDAMGTDCDGSFWCNFALGDTMDRIIAVMQSSVDSGNGSLVFSSGRKLLLCAVNTLTGS